MSDRHVINVKNLILIKIFKEITKLAVISIEYSSILDSLYNNNKKVLSAVLSGLR